MKKRRMILLVVSIVTILILAGVGVTYSLLSSVTPTATNTFQSDKEIKITLTEPNWQEHGKEQASAYVPGQVIDKDPTVTLSDNSVSSYVALKVQYYDEENELSFGEFRRLYLDRGANDDQMGIDFSGSWVYIGTEETDKEMIPVNMEKVLSICTRTFLHKMMLQQLFLKMLQNLYLQMYI